MTTRTVEVTAYVPAEGKALKLIKDDKTVTYMVVPYYELPGYQYKIEEVDIAEAERYYAKANSKLRKFSKLFR